jgi:hypothetical protein
MNFYDLNMNFYVLNMNFYVLNINIYVLNSEYELLYFELELSCKLKFFLHWKKIIKDFCYIRFIHDVR